MGDWSAAEVKEKILEWEAKVFSTSAPVRVHSYAEDLLPAIKNANADTRTKLYPYVVNVYLSTVHATSDAKTRSSSAAAMREVVRVSEGAFAALFVPKALKSVKSVRDPNGLTALFVWVAACLTKPGVAKLPPVVLDDAVKACLTIMTTVFRATVSRGKRATLGRKLNAAMTVPEVAACVLKALEKSPSERHSAAVCAVSEKAAKDGKYEENRGLFEAHLVHVVGNVSKATSADVFTDYRVVLSHATREFFGEKILPAVGRQMKRSMEVMVGAFPALAVPLKIDLSEWFVKPLLEDLKASLTAVNEDVRKHGVRAIGKISQRCSVGESTLEAFKVLAGMLSSGRVSNPDHKLAVLSAISKLNLAYSKDCFEMAEGMCNLIAKEANEDVKCAILRNVSLFLQHRDKASVSVPAPVVERLVTCLGDKTRVRLEAMGCAAHLMELPLEQNDTVSKIVPPLVKMVKGALDKPVQRSEGIAAVDMLLRYADFDSSKDPISDEKLLEPILKEGSMVFSIAAASRGTPVDCVNLLSVIAGLVNSCGRRDTSRLEDEGFVAVMCDTMVEALMHTHTPAGVEATTAADPWKVSASLDKISRALPDSEGKCLSAFLRRLRASAVEAAEAAALAPVNLDDVTAQMERNRWALKEISRCVLKHIAGELKPEAVSTLLQASVFPSVSCDVSGPKLWAQLRDETKSTLTTEVVDLTLGEVLSGAAAFSENKACQEGGMNALRVLFKGAAGSGSVFADKLLAGIEASGAANLSDNDLRIWYTPELDATPGGVGSVVTDHNRARPKWERKLYGDDDAWEAELRAELEAKKKAEAAANSKGPKKKLTPKEQAEAEQREKAQKARQGVIDRVALTSRSCARLVKVIEEWAAAAPAQCHEQLPRLSQQMNTLLGCELVTEESRSCIHHLASTAPDVRGAAVETLAKAMVRVMVPGASDDATHEVCAGTAEGLHASSYRGLSAGTLVLVLPILEKIMRSPEEYDVNSQEKAMELLQSSLRQSAAHIPSGGVTRLLLHVMDTLDKFVPQAREALVCVAQTLAGSRLGELTILLDGLLSYSAGTRGACLDALQQIPALTSSSLPSDDSTAVRLWSARFDVNEANAAKAEAVWGLYGHALPSDQYVAMIIPHLGSTSQDIRKTLAKAYAAGVKEYPSTLGTSLSAIFAHFTDNLPETVKERRANEPVTATSHIVDESELEMLWFIRAGIAESLAHVAPHLGSKDIPLVFSFLLTKGFGDENADVRETMLSVGTAIVNAHTTEAVPVLLPVVEEYLAKPPAASFSADRVRESVVIVMGALGKHMSADDPKVETALDLLIDALATPSERVQRAVAGCLPGLSAAIKPRSEALVQQLLTRCTTSEKFAERRGASFGLAGVVKALGISSLKAHNIMPGLQEAASNKKSPAAREGALSAFECLCEMLGRLFEPYIIHILPVLLECFSDSDAGVREACEYAARAIMSQLSGHGVKMVLPHLLKGLQDKAWRTKNASVDMLGAMAYCAPKQLSTCLPSIVPKLLEVLTDSHPKVQSSGKQALSNIGSVIKNPEISGIVPTILAALDDSSKHTKTALDLLLQTSFVHSIDAPSLALLMPILNRGLRERTSEVKKRAGQIVGSMCSLIADSKDIEPYITDLMPDLKAILVDPIPEVRAVAARALGSLMKGVGEDKVGDLVPWLMTTLKKEDSSVERAGAAQGLSEVLGALGDDRVAAVLPDIVAGCNHAKPFVREGNMCVYMFLPAALGSKFENHIPAILPSVLKGLADEAEIVRDVSLKVGRAVISRYGESAIAMMLPSLETGLFDYNWRIRQSSVQLLGDLLYSLGGGSEKAVGMEDDDEGFGSEDQLKVLDSVLGEEHLNQILSSVYMIRSDVNAIVRQASLQVWKSVVANTPRTLRRIMKNLMVTIVEGLSSSVLEKREVASRAIGDIVRKLGDKVLPEIIPVLQRGLSDKGDSDMRQGVCLGLSEVMDSCSKQQLSNYMGSFIPAIREALCDEIPSVREAGAAAFNTMYKAIGNKIIEDIVPPIIAQLQDSERSASALAGLKELLAVRASVILPHLVPLLISRPITQLHSEALSVLANVSGAAMHHYMSDIINSLVHEMTTEDGVDNDHVCAAGRDVMAAITTDGIHYVMSDLFKGLLDEDVKVKRSAALLVEGVARAKVADYSSYLDRLVQGLIELLNDPSEPVVKAAWSALDAIVKGMDKDDMPGLVAPVRRYIADIVAKEARQGNTENFKLRGLCVPKGFGLFLPVYLAGLMAGPTEQRETAASGLGEMIDLTTFESLKPFVAQIAGPLIRIIGDRFPWQVKSAILQTLCRLIDVGGVAMKAFVPQLQIIFTKSLQDTTKIVRSRAALALGKMISLAPATRVPTVLSELNSNVQSSSDAGVQEAMLRAMANIIATTGDKVPATVADTICTTLSGEILGSGDESIRVAAGSVIGHAATRLQDNGLPDLVKTLATAPGTVEGDHGNLMALAGLIKHNKAGVLGDNLYTAIGRGLTDDKVPVKAAALRAAYEYFAIMSDSDDSTQGGVGPLLPSISALCGDPSADIRKAALMALKRLAKGCPGVMGRELKIVVPHLQACVKAVNVSVKLMAERVLLHTLQLYKNNDRLSAYVKGVDGDSGKALDDYCRRVLSKLKEGSDGEDMAEEL